jgi:mRNA interferase MazF
LIVQKDRMARRGDLARPAAWSGERGGMASDSREGTLRLPGRASAAVPMLEARCKIKAPPNIRNVYYCGFPDAALPPEFSKRRPVIIVSYKNSLAGPVLVVPLTTQAQRENRWAVKLTRNPTSGEICNVWVMCNHLYTVSCARLTATHGVVPRLTPVEFRPVYELIM